ncbi:MAG TPA: glycosyltransferase [Gemmatimonadaceae bacterium]|nr:glycosyltransferase [Gemmatimonadaceae bacterium]
MRQPLPPGVPIVVFGDDWGRHVSSMQHLFRHLAGTHDVIWVNAISHRVPQLSIRDVRRAFGKVRVLFQGGRTGTAGEIEIGAQPRMIIHPKVLPWHHFRLVRAINRRSLTRAIRGALDQLGARSRPMLVTGSPPSIAVFGELGELASVYYCMDDFLHLPHVSAHMIAPLERELLDRVDAVVATAQALVVTKRPRSGRAHYLPQGVNYEHFATPQPVPPDLAKLPRPIIGFAGGLTTPVDLPLLRRLSEAFPNAAIVLVGPVHVDLTAIAAPNLHVLGARPYRDLPAYVQAFDVGIIPYVLNQHTIAVDPLKLLEYLSAGVPVVTTDLPEVRKYSDSVAIAPTDDAFVSAVRAALAARGDRAARQQVARQHGWDRRAEEFLGVLGELHVVRSPA